MNEAFESNLINWIVLTIGLAFLWQKFMPGIFADRRQRIEQAITQAEKIKTDGETFMANQRVRIENAKEEADQILVEAKQVAERMKVSIADQAQKDAVDLQKKIEQQISTHRQMVIAELRSQAAVVAVRLAEATLPGAITANVKQNLQEGFIGQLDAIGTKR